MQLRKSTIEKLADTLIRLGEASIIGGTATIFVENFPLWQSVLAIVGGMAIVTAGLYINNTSEKKGI